MAAFLIVATFLQFRHRKDPKARRRANINNTHFFCGWMVKNLNIDVKIKGQPTPDSNFLYIGNHMGFVDIFILASTIKAMFITSHEMRETPVLGTLCEMGGCLFVERRSRTRIMNELGTIKSALEDGFNVVLYPEATSTNGEAVLPFKKTLMMAAPQAARPIQLGCINYIEINGEPFNMKNRDAVCWYGGMTFVEAFWGTLTAASIKVELEFLQALHEPPDADRTEIATKSHAIISAHFRPPRPLDAAQFPVSSANFF